MKKAILNMTALAVAGALAVMLMLCAACGDKGTAVGDPGWEGDVDRMLDIVNAKYGDGGSYESVELVGLKWMKRNLNVETAESWCYNNSSFNCNTYGRLYTWSAAKSACQSVGWRLPTRDEWGQLAKTVGWGEVTAGRALKSTSGWQDSGNGTDSYGFSARPGGRRITDGQFDGVGYFGDWWTATEYSGGVAYNRLMYYDYDGLDEYYNAVGYGLSVRCVKDE